MPSGTHTKLRRTATFLTLAACGSRTGIDLLETSIQPAVDASVLTPDAARPRDTGVRIPVDAAGILDQCPSAVLTGSPLPMLGNCSTRDGRSRAVAPKSPQITWTVTPPPAAGINPTGQVVASDASGGVYVAGGPEVTSMLRVDGTTGGVAWVTALPTAVVPLVLAPFLDPGGTLQCASLGASGPALEAFDPTSGAVAPSSLPAGVGAGVPAIGADGSLYLQHLPSTPPVRTNALISRLLPDRSVLWTTNDLSHGSATFGGFLTLALGVRDAVIVVTVDTASTVFDLDPATGDIVWSTSLAGMAVSGPAVGPDGSIAVITLVSSFPSMDYALSVFEPSGSLRFTMSTQAATVLAVGLDGTILLGPQLTALDRLGATRWLADVYASNNVSTATVTIDGNGTVVVFANEITAVELATGMTLWTLPGPGGERHLVASRARL